MICLRTHGTLKALIAIGALLVLIGSATAHEPRKDRGHSQDHPWGGYSGGPQGLVTFSINHQEELGLSDGQVSKLKAIRNTFRKTSARVRAEIQEAEERFDDQMRLDSMNLGEIGATSKRMGGLDHELRIAFATAISDGKNTLSAKQLKKLKELRKRRALEK